MSTHAATQSASSFWCRQFAPQPTMRQVAFDVAFGIALPVVCLYFDPIVFRASHGKPLLSGYEVVAGVATGLGLLSLAAWLSVRRLPLLLAGLLGGGALFASLLGLVLLPFSIIGLLAVIGILGFTPFVTAFVFWRNSVRAFRRGREGGSASVLPVVLGLVVACGGPWAAQLYVTHETSRALEIVQSDDPAAAGQGLAVLKRFNAVVDLDPLVFAYGSEKDEGRRVRIAKVYRELTGSDLEDRLAALRD